MMMLFDWKNNCRYIKDINDFYSSFQINKKFRKDINKFNLILIIILLKKKLILII